MATGIGVAMAVPTVLVFGALYSSADPTFQRMFESIFDISPLAIVNHLTVSGFICVATIGYLRGLTLPPALTADFPKTLRSGRFGLIEIVIPMGALLILSSVFVILQIPYLFGGADIIGSNVNLNFSSYARRGFFELTSAAGLVIPVLMTADHLLEPSVTNRRVIRTLSLLQIGLVGILMSSAFHRMGLYWQEYGLTTTRFYASACMVWIGTVLVWFTLTVLRGRRSRFAFGSIVSGLVILAALNFANPEHRIARVNIDRATADKPFDAYYLLRLTPDAYPYLLDNLSGITATERCHIVTSLRYRLEDSPVWKSWTLSRQRANRAWRGQSAELLKLCADAGRPSTL